MTGYEYMGYYIVNDGEAVVVYWRDGSLVVSFFSEFIAEYKIDEVNAGLA